MNKLIQRLMIGLLLVVVSPLSYNLAQAAIPTSERDALLAFYTATTGAGWSNKGGWESAIAGTECSWFGVTCDVGETTVTDLELTDNNLIGTIPSSISDLTSLTVLDLRINQLSGSIPVEIGSLTALENLNLRTNQLSGNIPVEIGNLTNLVILNLRSNELTGPIPVELGNLTVLEELYLRSNDLSGTIPSELGNLTNLTVLSLRSNQFTGSIPAEIGNLTGLQELYLRSNVFLGAIPSTFINLTNLIVDGLNLRFNGLYTDDAALATFLNIRHVEEGGVRDFSLTQTVDADGVVATTVGATEVDIAWNAVSYTDDPGGYRIYRSTQPSSGFSMVADVADKATTTATLTGLTACTTYYVRVLSYTSVHVDGDVVAGNDNEVESDGLTGNVVQFKTIGCPTVTTQTTQPATGGGGGGGCTINTATPFDPLLPLLFALGGLYLCLRKDKATQTDCQTHRR